jgi:hypothetical protein
MRRFDQRCNGVAKLVSVPTAHFQDFVPHLISHLVKNGRIWIKCSISAGLSHLKES